MHWSKQAKFIAAVGVQIFIITVMIFVKLVILGTGTEVVLHIQPVDPRDPLRGDYLTFQYDISQVTFYTNNYDYSYKRDQNGMYQPNAGVRNGETVFVTLYKSGDVWHGYSASRTLPTEDTLFIKGTVVSGGIDESYPYQNPSDYYDQKITVRYGIEDYFIRENTGREAEAAVRNGSAKAIVVIDEKGNAVLKKLLINDKPF